jgi:hypothetical protein
LGIHKYKEGAPEEYNDWTKTVHKNREKYPCDCQLPENQGKFCIFHGWALSGTFYRGNIKSTPAADQLIQSRQIQYDEHGKALPSTPRGKRRRAKRATSS